MTVCAAPTRAKLSVKVSAGRCSPRRCKPHNPDKWQWPGDVEKRYAAAPSDLIVSPRPGNLPPPPPSSVQLHPRWIDGARHFGDRTPCSCRGRAPTPPFTTHHTLDLRCSADRPRAHLKRLVFGGSRGTNSRNLRNEGHQHRHNPEVHLGGGVPGLRRLPDMMALTDSA